jgi:hypothetical protein
MDRRCYVVEDRQLEAAKIKELRSLLPLRPPKRRSGRTRSCTALESLHLRPRGPRSGPGCSVPVRHHLIGPIRPTRGHTAISPHGGDAFAVRERRGDPRVVPSFRCTFLPDMPSSPPSGSSIIATVQYLDADTVVAVT